VEHVWLECNHNNMRLLWLHQVLTAFLRTTNHTGFLRNVHSHCILLLRLPVGVNFELVENHVWLDVSHQHFRGSWKVDIGNVAGEVS